MAQVKFYKDGDVWVYTDGVSTAEKTAPAGEYRRIVYGTKVGIIGEDNIKYLFKNQLVEVTDIQKSATPDDNYASVDAFETATEEFFAAVGTAAYDETTGGDNVNVLNPEYNHETCPEPAVSAADIGAVDDTWVTQFEADTRTYDDIVLWVIFSVNDSTGCELRVICLDESGGSDDYILETESEYLKVLGSADRKTPYPFEVEGIPYIKVQTKATTVGATPATVTLKISKR